MSPPALALWAACHGSLLVIAGRAPSSTVLRTFFFVSKSALCSNPIDGELIVVHVFCTNWIFRKAALNMLTVMYGKDLPKFNPALKVNAGCPGHTSTSFTKHSVSRPLIFTVHYVDSNVLIYRCLKLAPVPPTKVPRLLPGLPRFRKMGLTVDFIVIILHTRKRTETSKL